MPHPESLPIRILLTALVAFGPLSTDLYLPSLPTLVRVFGTDVATVQLTLSVFLAGFAISQLVYGPMSDRFGRRPALLAGVVIYLAASAVCAMTSSIEALIAARFFQALGACCGPVVARAVVRDVFGRERSATVLAYMSMAMALAPAVGPMLGGVLTEWFGWRANFVLLTGFACVILAAVWGMLGETNAHRDADALRPGRMLANYLLLLRNRGFIGYVLVVAFCYSGIFSFISGSSFVLIDRLHLTPAQYGASFGSVVLGYMLGTFLAGRLTPRLGGARMIRLGTSLSLAGGVAGGLLALAGVLHLAAILVPVFLFILGAGLTLPNATANAVGPYPTMAGLASSLLGFAQMTVAAAVGIVVGHLADGSPLPMMGAIGLVGLGALAAHRLLVIPAATTGRSA
ncbi:multidrug effflux MFS transporter [Azospirillum picis]|uniref:Bcr/CflA family efflux transporter n=1 Tax=Azospirillum picis TaxID=488438 RepID=A0ABU0MRI8_9PROT|nr:multidrug effflux MFS transporter [Azospirillum picis]MBP2302250.1 DHA1 family bicyclomycin/chloramphenicol resistance-like MFS transporter [Azospirillum picis]MDQ0535829.1 DHA1 family bicyclomycin/chloramphenicol resistance-like MFS transporter [Azospirillum picis]